ncbi:MAG TPA: DUF2249 domain-containing protein, partial [Candidatus Aquilonibacter sp.]
MDIMRVDVRALPVWERPAKISEVFEKLPLGASITFVTENEPRGLAFRMEQKWPHEIIVDHRRTGDHEWTVRLTRA